MMMRAITALFLTLALTTGCSQSPDPWNPAKTPNPGKRYDVTVLVSDAPWPARAVTARAFFAIVNPDCVRRNSLSGTQDIPVGLDRIEMAQVGEKIWRGYFYRDFFQDEDYFKLGVCHWDVTAVGISFISQSMRVDRTIRVGEFLKMGAQTTYLKRKADGDAISVEGEYFWVTVAVEEAAP